MGQGLTSMQTIMFQLTMALFVTSGLLGTGCSTVSSASSKSIKREAISGKAIRILSVQASDDAGETLVSGGMKRNAPYHLPLGAHLDITAFDSQNRIIASKESSINTTMSKRHLQVHSMIYAARLNVSLKDIARIRIEYHGGKHREDEHDL